MINPNRSNRVIKSIILRTWICIGAFTHPSIEQLLRYLISSSSTIDPENDFDDNKILEHDLGCGHQNLKEALV